MGGSDALDMAQRTPLGSPVPQPDLSHRHVRVLGEIDDDADLYRPVTPTLVLELLQRAMPSAVACFLIRRALVAVLMRFISSQPKSSSDAHEKRVLRVALYILSTAQATFGTVYSIVHLRTADAIRAETADPVKRHEMKDALVHQTKLLMEALLGYLIHDTLSTIDQWRQYPADMLHHGLGITLVVISLARARLTMEFVPAFLRLETSTVALNCMWFFREFPQLAQALPLVDQALPKVFVLLYFAIRMVWFPWYLRKMATEFPVVWNEGLGSVGKRLMMILHALQTYWFGLIVKKMVLGTGAQ